MNSKAIVCILLCLSVFVGGCAIFGRDGDDETEDWTAEKLYDEAKDRMQSRHYDGAIQYYEFLQQRFPFGTHAQQAQLDVAYCYYKIQESASATAALDRFIKLYPTHVYMDYAYYLKGVVNFNIGKGFAERFVARDPSQRDPGVALRSFQDFGELVRRFPDSRYVEDSRLRMTYLRNLLAQHEINVAIFYMRRSAYVAAANRARYVVENYQQAPVMPDALVVLAKAYTVLELNDLAGDAIRVLEMNYPGHPGIAEVLRTRVR